LEARLIGTLAHVKVGIYIIVVMLLYNVHILLLLLYNIIGYVRFIDRVQGSKVRKIGREKRPSHGI